MNKNIIRNKGKGYHIKANYFKDAGPIITLSNPNPTQDSAFKDQAIKNIDSSFHMGKGVVRNVGKGHHIKANYFSGVETGSTIQTGGEQPTLQPSMEPTPPFQKKSWLSSFGDAVTSPQGNGGASQGAAAGGGSSAGGKGFMANMKNTFSGSNVGGMVAGAAGAIGSAVGNLAGGAIADGLESKAGSGISKVGGAIGSAVGTVNPILGAAISAASGIIGGGVSRLWGSKMNQEFINGVETNNKQLNNVNVGVGSYDNIMNQMGSTNFGNEFGQNKVGRDGTWSHKAKDKYNSLIHNQRIAQNRAYTTFGNAVDATEQIADDNAQNAFVAAYGGKLHTKHNKQNIFAYGGQVDMNNNKNIFAIGGPMTSFKNQATVIGAGGTHEQNPNGGVQIGMDHQGTPNYLEEGEVKFGDYVFSNRLYATGGELIKSNLPEKYKNHTFASIAEDIDKKTREEPNDPITENEVKSYVTRLRGVQEVKRQAKAAQMQKKKALAMGAQGQMTPEQQQMMAMQQQQQGQQEQPSEEEQMQQMQQQQQEQQSQEEEGQEQQQEGQEQQEQGGETMMAAYGGNVYKGGGPVKSYSDENMQSMYDDYLKSPWTFADENVTSTPRYNYFANTWYPKTQKKNFEAPKYGTQSMKDMDTALAENPYTISDIPYNSNNKRIEQYISQYYPATHNGEAYEYPNRNGWQTYKQWKDANIDELNNRPSSSLSSLRSGIYDGANGKSPEATEIHLVPNSYQNPFNEYITADEKYLTNGLPKASVENTYTPQGYEDKPDNREFRYVNADPNSSNEGNPNNVNPPIAAYARFFSPLMEEGRAVSDSLGFTNQPNYHIANEIQATPHIRDVSSPHVGGYLQYKPVDRNRDINVMRAENAASRNALIRLGAGNRATMMANIAANDLSHQGKIGDLTLNADKQDAATNLEYAKYNLGIKTYNAEADMKAQAYNMDADKTRSTLAYQAALERAKMKQEEYWGAKNARLHNYERAMEDIGNMGREAYDYYRVDNNKDLVFNSNGNYKDMTGAQKEAYRKKHSNDKDYQYYLDHKDEIDASLKSARKEVTK